MPEEGGESRAHGPGSGLGRSVDRVIRAVRLRSRRGIEAAHDRSIVAPPPVPSPSRAAVGLPPVPPVHLRSRRPPERAHLHGPPHRSRPVCGRDRPLARGDRRGVSGGASPRPGPGGRTPWTPGPPDLGGPPALAVEPYPPHPPRPAAEERLCEDRSLLAGRQPSVRYPRLIPAAPLRGNRPASYGGERPQGLLSIRSPLGWPLGGSPGRLPAEPPAPEPSTLFRIPRGPVEPVGVRRNPLLDLAGAGTGAGRPPNPGPPP